MARPQTAAAQKRPPLPAPDADTALTDFITWKDELPALGLRNRFGRENWIAQTRIDGRTTRRTLGTASSLTREASRQAGSVVPESLRAEWAEAAISPDTTMAAFAEMSAVGFAVPGCCLISTPGWLR